MPILLNGSPTALTSLPEYGIWVGIKKRCSQPSHHAYHYYGGRGITICREWADDFGAFLKHVGRRPADHYQLDRIDNDGNYEPGNVRWATRTQQMRNRRCVLMTDELAEQIRSRRGMSHAEIASELGVPKSAVWRALDLPNYWQPDQSEAPAFVPVDVPATYSGPLLQEIPYFHCFQCDCGAEVVAGPVSARGVRKCSLCRSACSLTPKKICATNHENLIGSHDK